MATTTEDVLVRVVARYRRALQTIVAQDYPGASFIAREAMSSEGLPEDVEARLTETLPDKRDLSG